MNGLLGGHLGWVLGAMTPEMAGQMTGPLMVWLGVLAGMVWCWRISRRPGTNKAGVFSLLALLSGFFIPASMTTAAHLLGTPFPAGGISGVMGLGMMGAFVLALVLAIVGLSEISRHADRYQRGRAQAIATLVVFGLLVGCGFIGIIIGVSRKNMVTLNPGQISKFEDENFEFKAPGSPWVSLNAAKINKEAKLALLRPYPETYFVIVAETTGSLSGYSTEQYADLCKEHMRGVSGGNMRVIRETPLEINGLNGLLDGIEAQVASHAVFYQQWYVVTNGYAYELTAWGSSANEERVAEDARPLLNGFKQIDPRRMAATGGRGFAENHVSWHYDYLVNVTNSAWHPSATLEKNSPYADFTASQGDSCLEVVPVWLGERKVGGEALTAGLLATFDVDYPNEQLTHRQRFQEGRLAGVVYDFARTVDGARFNYRFKIAQAGSNAWLVAAWTQRKDAEVVLADALERVKLEAQLTPPLNPTPEHSEREQKTLGFVLNQAGLHHQKAGEYEAALPLFCAALQANAQEPVYLQNALLAWRDLDRPKEALAFLARQPSASLAPPEVRADLAYFQAQADLSEPAISNYAAVFANGYRNDLHFTTYVNLLSAQHQYDQALAAVENYLQAEDSVTVRLLEAAIYRQKKEFPKAISRLKTQREAAPDDSRIATALAETFLQAGQYNEALTISRGLRESSGDSAYVDYLNGQSELGLKWYREARKSFEAAARLAPANKEIRSYLDLVNSLAGEGDNSLVREVIEPVALPASLTNEPAAPVPADYATNYGAYYARRITAVSYQAGKEYKTTEYARARVLDAYGVSAFSTVQFEFDPLNEQLHANEIRVLDADGKTISTGQVDNFYVLDERTSGTASQKKILNIPVSGLRPGCQLVVTITRRNLGALTEFPFLEHTFAGPFPTRESIFYLSGDIGGLKFRTSPPVEPEKPAGGLVWRVREPLSDRWEPLQPSPASYLPMLWVGDAAAHWPDIASNYLAAISDRLQPDPPLRELVGRLVDGATNNTGKLAALARYVQTNFTYKAIEFGRRSRIPNPPAEIIRNQYGDCKDHAVLLQQMLTVAGVPARLALVNSRDLIQPDLPSLDQFNHMIVQADGRFLDCTSKGADVPATIPYGQAGREALILDPQNPRFVTMPAYPANASTLEVQEHVRLVERTDLAVEETLVLGGVAAAGMREYLQLIPQDTLKTSLQRQFNLTDAVLDEVHIESLTTPSAPLRVTCSYRLKSQFHPLDDRLTGTLRLGLARAYLAPAATDDRRTPFEVQIPGTFHGTVTLDAPEGFQAQPPEAAEIKLNSRFVTGRLQTRRQGSGLQLEFEYQMPTGRFAAADYAAYQEAMNRAVSLLEKAVVFKPNLVK